MTMKTAIKRLGPIQLDLRASNPARRARSPDRHAIPAPARRCRRRKSGSVYAAQQNDRFGAVGDAEPENWD